MGKVDIDQLAVGMRLSKAVKDLSGRVLMGEGSPVTESSIRILKMWGVVEVDIVDAGNEGQESSTFSHLDPNVVEEAAREAAERFRHTDQKLEVVGELIRLTTLRIARAKTKEMRNAGESA